MNFFKKMFYRSLTTNMDSSSKEDNNIITTTRETSIEQSHLRVNDSNNLTTEINIMANTDEDNVTNKDSSVVSIKEFGVTKTLHNLINVEPIEIIPIDNTTCKELEDIAISLTDHIGSENALLLIGPAEATPVNFIENEPEINNNDLKEAKVSNDATTSNNVIDDETMQSLKEFEEALNSIENTTLSDLGADFINLDEFIEIFDELNPENEDPISINSSGKSVCVNDENTFCKEKEITDTKNERQLNVNENIEVIYISSSEDEVSQREQIKDTVTAFCDQSDSDDGYNSSDFEFISETEANMTGITINYGLDNCQNISPASSEPLINYCGLHIPGEAEMESSDPGEGPSGQNRPRNEFEDRSYRNNHNIPERDDYLGLFQGIYNPLLPMSDIYFLENKSVRTSAMNSQYDGIGFDRQLALRRHQPDSSEDECELIFQMDLL